MTEAAVATTSAPTPAPAPGASPFTQPIPEHARANEAANIARNGTWQNTLDDGAHSRLDANEQAKWSRAPGDGNGGPSKWVLRSEFEAATVGTTAKSSDPTAAGDRAVVDPATMAAADRVTVAAGDGTTFELSGDDFAAFMQHRAAEQARKQSVPADAAAYQAKLPDTLKLPQGVEFRVDEASPALRDFRAWAHQRGFTQDDFSTALGFMAAHSGAQEAQMREVMNAERAKLGPNIASRVDAVSNFMRGHLGDAGARAIQSMMVSAAIVENLEKLVTKFATQGHASFSQAHRDPGGGSGLVSEEQFNSMSHAERMDYTRSAAARNAMAGRR